MAKSNKPSKQNPPIKDRSIFWSDISYFPIELKNEVWAAQIIYFAKKNGRLFVDQKRAREYRMLDLLEANERDLKQMVDPITPEGSGGEAKYFSSDWKAYPIYIRLQNNIRAEVQRTAKQIEVNFTDKYAKTRKMRDNYRVLYTGLFRDIINEYAPRVGLPQISESQDPYKWVKELTKNVDNKGKQEGKPDAGGGDVIGGFVDLIKNQIQDSQDLALYNEFIYKGDYEQAIEKGIKHYMFNQNKWDDRWSDDFFDDIRHFNRAAGEWYTDLVTGRPVVERYDPALLYTSPFKRKDGSDIQYYFTEYLISFADFIKTIGHGLKSEKLKQVFEYNKTQGSNHGLNWIEFDGRANTTRDNAMIRVGRCACLTQDYEVFLDGVTATYPFYDKQELSWNKDPNNQREYKKDEKNYNVWRSFYYIPPTTSSLSNADYAWQANFIFGIKKNQDQFRYGEEGRYVKSPLVIYDNRRNASYTDIMKAYTDKIDFAWQNYQNCLINDFDAMALSDDFIGGLLAAVDEENNISAGSPDEPTGGNGRDALMEQWKMIKQGGKGFLKMTDKQGKPIMDERKLQMTFKNGYLEKAELWMAQIAVLYNQLVTALGSETGEAKPRVPVAGVEEQLKSSDNSRWFIEKAYSTFVKEYAERFVSYILAISKEPTQYGYHNRYNEFLDVIGLSNGLLIKGLEDTQPEEIGLTVNYVDSSSKKDFVMQLATGFMQQGKLSEDILYLVMGVDNWKQAWVLVRMGIKQRAKELAAQAALQHQQEMEQKQMDLQIAQTLTAAKGEAKDKNIMTAGKIKQMVDAAMNEGKAKTMAQQKAQLLNNKKEENAQKAQLEKEGKTYDALAPA